MTAPSDRLFELDDYISGDMSDEAADAFEEALFADTAEGGEAAFLDKLARFSAHLVQHGTFHMGITHAQLEDLRRRGKSIDYRDPGDAPSVRLAPPRTDVDLFILRIPVDLEGVERLDAEIEIEGHGQLKVIRDVTFDPADGAIFACCEPPLASMAFGAGRSVTRLVAVEPTGRRTLREFDYIPTTDP